MKQCPNFDHAVIVPLLPRLKYCFKHGRKIETPAALCSIFLLRSNMSVFIALFELHPIVANWQVDCFNPVSAAENAGNSLSHRCNPKLLS